MALLSIAVIALWVAPTMVANNISKAKGRGNAGLILGLVLGWVGVLVMALIGTGTVGPRRACPHCGEQIRYEASVCHWCHRDVEPAAYVTWR